MSHSRATPIALLTLAAALCSPPANALDATAYSASTAANACLPALPAYEGTIRKRPLGVQNEGATAAFVTCSLVAGNYVKRVSLFASSVDGQAHTLPCTVVLGAQGFATYLTRSAAVTADGVPRGLHVNPADVSRPDDLGTQYVSFSCQLPPGVGITDINLSWQQYVGT